MATLKERLVSSLNSMYRGTIVSQKDTLVRMIHKNSLPFTDVISEHRGDETDLKVDFGDIKVIVKLIWAKAPNGLHKLYKVT